MPFTQALGTFNAQMSNGGRCLCTHVLHDRQERVPTSLFQALVAVAVVTVIVVVVVIAS